MELKPCPFCGSKEAVEYWCGHETDDCPFYYEEEFFEFNNRECCFDCIKRHETVVCNFNKGGCGAMSGHDGTDAGWKWNKRAY